jgi:hypothetical protein
MKRLVIIGLIFLFSCKQESKDAGMRIAGMEQKTNPVSYSRADSLQMEEQDRYNLWMRKTYYALRHEGHSNKKAWLYIDSLTKQMYKDSVPHWYARMKRESDSTIKVKNRYKRIRIV